MKASQGDPLSTAGHRPGPGSRCVLFALAVASAALALPVAAQESAIDLAALMQDLQSLSHDSMGGRRVGTEGNARARRYLIHRLEEMGVAADSQSFSAGSRTIGVNLIARIRGTEPANRAIVLSAHFDHLGTRNGEVFNGADDNASGVSGLLAIASTFMDTPLRHDVILAFFDAEEGGLMGSRAWIDELDDPVGSVALVLNLDMVSRSDRVLWVVGTHQNPDLRVMVEGVAPAPGVELRFGHDSPEWTGSDNWVGSSDHAAFHRAGVPFLYFGVEDHPDYHRPTDHSDRVDPAWYAAAIETIRRVLLAADAR
jgi:Zn-dependent M28 family amino/carboxypeptidase